MVDEFYVRKNGFGIGDELELESEEFKKSKFKVEIVGTVDSFIFTISRNAWIISEEQFKKDVADIPAIMFFEVDEDLDDMKKKMYNEMSGENISIQTIEEHLTSQEEQVAGILSVIWIFIVLSVLLSSIGLINNQVIGFMQRKREFAVLYSVAMSKAQINTMIFFETINSFLIGCASGLVLSLWLSKPLEGLLGSIGVYVKFTLDWISILGVVGIIFLALVLTTSIPMFKISKMNVLEEIKYE